MQCGPILANTAQILGNDNGREIIADVMLCHVISVAIDDISDAFCVLTKVNINTSICFKERNSLSSLSRILCV